MQGGASAAASAAPPSPARPTTPPPKMLIQLRESEERAREAYNKQTTPMFGRTLVNAVWCVIFLFCTSIVLYVRDGDLVHTPRQGYPAEAMQEVLNETKYPLEWRGRHIHFRVFTVGFGAANVTELQRKLSKHYIHTVHAADSLHGDWAQSITVEDFDDVVRHYSRQHFGHGPQSAAQFDVFVVPPNATHEELGEKTTESNEAEEGKSAKNAALPLVIGVHRAAWIETSSLEDIRLVSTIVSLRAHLDGLPPVYNNGSDFSTGVQGEGVGAPVSLALRLPYSTYHLSLTLLNMDPSAWSVDWPAAAIQNQLMHPFVESLNGADDETEAIRFVVDTQIVHHGSFEQAPRWDDKLNAFAFPVQRARKLFAENGDWSLDSQLHSNREKQIHLLILVPPPSVCPLVVLGGGRKAAPAPGNMWAVPEWGVVGVLCPPNDVVKLANSSEETNTDNHEDAQYVQHAFGVHDIAPYAMMFAHHVKLFLNITWRLTIPSSLNAVVLTPRKSQVAQWETDLWHRHVAYKTADRALWALRSLHNVLEEHSNLPVTPLVANRTQRGIEYLRAARAGGSLLPHMRRSQFARSYAESALFSPSLMGQLYIPPTHLIALLMPFFFPFGLGVCFAVLSRIREMWKRNKLSNAYYAANKARVDHEEEIKPKPKPEAKKSAQRKPAHPAGDGVRARTTAGQAGTTRDKG